MSKRLANLAPFVSEGPWMLLGMVFGWFLPVINWFGVDFKLWVFLVATLVALGAVLAAKLLRSAFRTRPSNGWSILKIIIAAAAPVATSRSRFLAYAAVGLDASGMILCGILLGQVLSIYVGTSPI